MLAACVVVILAGSPVQAETLEAPLNVVLISLDTVRPDHLSCYGYHRRTTPHIDRIAQEGLHFTQAFVQSPTTFPSHLSIFTSQYPRRAWVFWEEADPEADADTLTELLKRHGYATGAFVGFREDYDGFKRLLNMRAFQTFDQLTHGITLAALPEQLFDWLDAHRTQPFFLFVHGLDAHDPHVLDIQYDAKRFNPDYRGPLPSTRYELGAVTPMPPAELQQLPTSSRYQLQRGVYLQQLGAPDAVRPQELEHMQAVYDAQLYYLDQGLGELFQALRNLGLMDRTLLVMFSDHGQAFGEHGYYAWHWHCYDEVTRMVLIVRDPRESQRGRAIQHVVQAIDIMPTILELLDLSVPASVEGRSLVPLVRTGQDPERQEMAVSVGQGTRAIRTPEWKLISIQGNPAELYNVRADPHEQHNLLAEHPDVAAQLYARLQDVVGMEVADPSRNPEEWMQTYGYW